MKTYADSGAATHCFYNVHPFVKDSSGSCEEQLVLLVGSTSVQAQKCGEVILEFQAANIRLKQVLLILSLAYDLVYTALSADNVVESGFRKHDVVLEPEPNRIIIGYETRVLASIMYMLSASLRATSCAKVSNMGNVEKELLHRRIAHIINQDLA